MPPLPAPGTIAVERVTTRAPAPGRIRVDRVAGRAPAPGRLRVERLAARRPRPGSLAVERVRARRPQAQSLEVTASGEREVGRTDDGTISVAEGVVAKIASRAAVEVPDAGGAAPRLLGRELSAPGLHLRRTSLDALPKVSAQVDGSSAYLSMVLSVRYPAPVRSVAAAVRSQVRDRVHELTGLTVQEVDVRIPALVTELPAPPRVR